MHGVEVLRLELFGHSGAPNHEPSVARSSRPALLSGCADGTVKQWLLEEKDTTLDLEEEAELYS